MFIKFSYKILLNLKWFQSRWVTRVGLSCHFIYIVYLNANQRDEKSNSKILPTAICQGENEIVWQQIVAFVLISVRYSLYGAKTSILQNGHLWTTNTLVYVGKKFGGILCYKWLICKAVYFLVLSIVQDLSGCFRDPQQSIINNLIGK